jgi:hypothetical protein
VRQLANGLLKTLKQIAKRIRLDYTIRVVISANLRNTLRKILHWGLVLQGLGIRHCQSKIG